MDPNQSRIFRAGAEGTEIVAFPEKDLSDAAGRWDASPHADPATVIAAACQALVAGLDSPALRVLAGLSRDSRRDEVDGVLWEALDELGIPRAGDLRLGRQVAHGGAVEVRPPADHIRFAITAASESVGGFEVQVFVNDTEMTAAGAGMGMDPYDVLIPENRFAATETARRIPIARCECGTYGCGVTDVSILRDGDVVHWDWHDEVPMNRGVTFPAAEYDAEVARLAADLSWETPDRTAGRLVLTLADHDGLARHDLRIGWVANDYRDASRFCVCLMYADTHQVFVYTSWAALTPHALADDTVRLLTADPRSWPAEWHAIQPGLGPPRIASRKWRQHVMP